MIVVKKKKLKRPVLLAITAGVLALLTVAAILLNTLLAADDGDGGTKKPAPEIIEGVEDVFNGMAVAFPRVEETHMSFIRVLGEQEYFLMRESAEGEEESKNAPFRFYYRDAADELQMYYPDICVQDPTFEYEDLYAVEQSDSFGSIPKLTYLCVAIGTPYFDERIELPEDAAEREIELKRFGLSDADTPIRVDFNYETKEGETKTHTLKIGKKNITGVGYYFTVDDRAYVYSGSNNYFDYALLDFADYISPILTAAGLPQDNAFEPYLTTDFKQWVNTIHETEGEILTAPAGADERIADVIMKAIRYTPSINDKNYTSGYIVDNERGISFDIDAFAKSGRYDGIVSQIMGMKIGKLEQPLRISFPTYSKTVELEGGKSAEYEYTFTAIEAAISNGVETTEAGAPVGAADSIKVTYRLSIGGKSVSDYDMHGIIRLDAEMLTDEVRAALSGASIGKLDTPPVLKVVYDENNTVVREVKIVITEIIKIFNDKNEDIETAGVGTKVMYRHKIVLDGEELGGDYTDAVTITENMSGTAKDIADALSGKKVGKLSAPIDIEGVTAYSEGVADFIAYEISELRYFVTSKLITSFRFEQASDRDAYYGESFYANTMENTDGSLHKYGIYALNASSCEAVVRLFGGLETNASQSTGLIGLETVAVGLTPEIMKEYDLYDHTVYFEIPRGITSIVYDDVPTDEFLDSLDDYTYYSTLGFTLYISRPQSDGSRFIASSQYDVVAKVDAERFPFLEMNFIEFYARRNLILTSISDINNITLDFYMEDLYGTYSNELQHTELYAYNGRLYTKSQLTEEELSSATKYDGINVTVTPSGECSDTKFSDFLREKGYTYSSLYEFYDKKTHDLDSLGTANFKEFAEILFYTRYESFYKEGESKEGPLLMKMKVRLYEGYSVYDYVYEFYRTSDRRVMVKLYREDRIDGTKIQEVSDFYISTFAFKKAVNAYMGILNGDNIDGEIPYPDAVKAD